MSLVQTMQEDRRGIILCGLDEANGAMLGEGSVKSVLGAFGHLVSSAEVRGDLDWLDQQGLVRVTKVLARDGSDLWTVQPLEAGQDVARGVRHPGIRKQAPKR